MSPIETLDQLDNALSTPTPAVLDTLRQLDGDLLILGAGGKMGPTLARMARRALDTLGSPHRARRVIAVSRFSSPNATAPFHAHGIETIACDLLDPAAVRSLPDAPNVLYLAGQKFGTRDAPELTWAMNTLVPATIAQRYPHSRCVVFSTGCVYPLLPTTGPGASEDTPLTPPGEYANSCVGRERLFAYFARQNHTPTLFFRLCYAIDLRYGVLLDIAQKIAADMPVDVTMGHANVIWQGDANARALQCLAHTTTPPTALNVTGLERVSIRSLAHQLGEALGRSPRITGSESPNAWIWDASRSYQLFGPPTVSLDDMIQATAHWLRIGGATLNKPTHFEVQDGQF